ncbi:MAG: hypothetical protein ACJA0Q_000024 [Saprospiraceae bacterium]
MLFNLIFKREAIFTIALSGVWLLCSMFWALHTNLLSSGIFMSVSLELIAFYLLMGLVSFYFNQVLRSTKLVGNNDFSALFLSVMAMSGLEYSSVSFQFVLAFFLLLMLINKIQQGFNQTENIISEFEMGVISGLLTMINPLFIVALPFTYVALVNVKVNTWRGCIAVLLGFFFMLFAKWCYFIFTDQADSFMELIKFNFVPKGLLVKGILAQVSSGLLLLVFVLSANHFVKVSGQLNIKIRVYYKVWLWLSLFLLSGFLLIENSMTVPQILLCINLPLLVLYQLAIRAFSKKIAKELAILILMLVVLLLKF